MSIKNDLKKAQKQVESNQHNEYMNSMVEAAIFQLAIGFTITEEKVVETEKGLKEKITITKEIEPDLKAALAWLYNRCPEKWSETQTNQETFDKVNQIINELNIIANGE